MNCRAAAKSVSNTSVKASAADARTGKFGSGILSQADARRASELAAEEWRYRRPPCSTQYRLVNEIPEGRTEEPGAIRIARAGVLSPGTAGHR